VASSAVTPSLRNFADTCAGPDAAVEVVDGSVEDRRFLATYTERGEVTAVLGMNMPAKVMRWRSQLASAST
jgi:hypothetical protein